MLRFDESSARPWWTVFNADGGRPSSRAARPAVAGGAAASSWETATARTARTCASAPSR
jgi:hypothetical protein